VGFVVKPVQGLSLGVDAFSIKLEEHDHIGVDPKRFGGTRPYSDRLITRGAPTANCPGCPGTDHLHRADQYQFR